MFPSTDTTTATFVFTTGIDGTNRTAHAVWCSLPTTPTQACAWLYKPTAVEALRKLSSAR